MCVSRQEEVSQEPHEEYLTTNEVAQRTKTSRSFWEKLRVTGGGPEFQKCGHLVRYQWPEVVKFMNSKARRSTSDGAQDKCSDAGL